jgi:hypothetical protein
MTEADQPGSATHIHLPINPTQGITKIQADMPLPHEGVPPPPRPRDDEVQPFSAPRVSDWLIAYA